jgi:hypothetical protein
MKYLIVGRQGCGIKEIVELSEKMGISVGHIFRNISEIDPRSYTLSKLIYDYSDIENIEESNSYIFMQECFQKEKFLEGLSFYEYDRNDVIYMGIDHIVKIPQSVWDKMDVTIIWLDNTSDFRFNYMIENGYIHDFNIQEDNESFNIQGFIDRVYDKKHIYFFNEEPKRVAAILYSLVKHPDLLDIFIQNFD